MRILGAIGTVRGPMFVKHKFQNSY
jgi:hypothetical protein